MFMGRAALELRERPFGGLERPLGVRAPASSGPRPQREWIGGHADQEREGGHDHEVEDREKDASLDVTDLVGEALPCLPQAPEDRIVFANLSLCVQRGPSCCRNS